MIDSKIQELVDNPKKMYEELHIEELDKMVHGFFPRLAFTMDYYTEIDTYNAYLCAECREDLTVESGIFLPALKKCKFFIRTDGEIRRKDGAGYQFGISMKLAFKSFDAFGGGGSILISGFWLDGNKWIKQFFKGWKGYKR